MCRTLPSPSVATIDVETHVRDPLDLPLDRLLLVLMGARADKGHDHEERYGDEEVENTARDEAHDSVRRRYGSGFARQRDRLAPVAAVAFDEAFGSGRTAPTQVREYEFGDKRTSPNQPVPLVGRETALAEIA